MTAEPRHKAGWLANCLWLFVPALAFNLAFAGLLPAEYQPGRFGRDIPDGLQLAENGLRLGAMLLAALMSLALDTAPRRAGLALWAAGTGLYLASRLPLIAWPDSDWSQSLVGGMAPAYTPALWLAGIGLIGYRSAPGWRAAVSWTYWTAAAGFLAAHNLHTWLVLSRDG